MLRIEWGNDLRELARRMFRRREERAARGPPCQTPMGRVDGESDLAAKREKRKTG